ncbi:hypothetical protein [Kitasatospora sp. NPDC059327]|uniref:hypothetical protein n=1 Tax=Kitasatospora sp. NPDC059327 TaxID=3346803 RepID=UPI003689C2F5
MARPYDQTHDSALFEQRSLPSTERTCPLCGHLGLRIYYHEKLGRPQPSWIIYLWCPACHAYSSAFAGSGRNQVTEDPLAEEFGERIKELFRDPEALLRHLDGYWNRGSLPQEISRRRKSDRGR